MERWLRKLNEYIFPVLGILILLVLILAIVTAVLLIKYIKGPGVVHEVCNEPGCLSAAAEILETIDDKIDPCENFYKFACGGWIAKNIVPLNSPKISEMDLMKQRIRHKISEAFMDIHVDDKEPKFRKFIPILYKSCLQRRDDSDDSDDSIEDNKAYDKAVLSKLKRFIDNIGYWPLTYSERQTWEGNFSFITAVQKAVDLGLEYDFYLNFKILPYVTDRSLNKITFLQPNLYQKDKSYYIGAEKEKNQANYVENVKFRRRHLNKHGQSFVPDIVDMFRFEESLANICKNESLIFSDITLHTIENLAKKFSKINWMQYLNDIANPMKISKDEIIQIYRFSQFQNIYNVITKMNKRLQANYFIFRIIHSFLNSLYLLDNQCYDVVTSELKIALASAYVRLHFRNNRAQKMASEIVSYIKEIIISTLKQNKLMTPSVQGFAVTKIMKSEIGFPFMKELLNDTIINGYYADLNFHKTDKLYIIFEKINKWKRIRSFKLLNEMNVDPNWEINTVIGPTQRRTDIKHNRIEISPTLAADPLFNDTHPNYMNFGGIGSIIGRKFMKLVLPPGNTVDEDGYTNFWWDKETLRMHKETESCLIDQYNAFKLTGGKRNLNGTLTLRENFVDNTGVSIAYKAYLAWEKENGTEPILPGLSYTQKQLFWISLGRVWCSKYDAKIAEEKYLFDHTHSLDIFRLLGVVANNEDFSRDFNCPLGSKMNPVKKCHVFGK